MDKLVAFFKNVWFKRGVAVICWGYTALLCWVAWLNFAFYFEFENVTALFVLYLFVNIAALGLMIYTRRQVITMVNAMLLPPIVFVIVILGFGNWYMIFPPLCVVVAMFFICAANETLKTVIGTMYLLLYVIGVVAYIAVNLLMGKITFTDVDLSLRDPSFENVSPTGEYRIVRYVDKPNGERRTAGYYVEYTGEDVEIPFGICKKVLGCKRVLTSKYTDRSDNPVVWIDFTEYDTEVKEILSVEGSITENPYLKAEITDDVMDYDAVLPETEEGSSESYETLMTLESAETVASGE